MSRRTLFAATAAIAVLPSTAGATTRTPVVRKDRTATFTFRAPAARTVEVRGGWGPSFGLINQPMTNDGGGTWTLTTGPLTPDYYQYSLVVDGVETKDPTNPSSVHSSPSLSTFLVPGKGIEFLVPGPGLRGQVSELTYHSTVTGSRRAATVWMPPGHRGRNLPTFYLQHGGGGDHLDWIEPGRANVILDNLYEAGRLRPMVVVMPDGTVPGATGLPGDDSYPAELLDNLVPAVERAFGVLRGPEHRALAGLSLGGLQTWNVLLSRPGSMAHIGDFSSGYFPEVLDGLVTRHADLLRDPRVDQRTRLHRVYCGNPDDIAYTNNVATRAVFERFGIRHTYSEFAPGGHTWQTWRDNLRDFAPRLFQRHD